MVDNLLFLLGGGRTSLEIATEEFVLAAGGRDATIALLLAGGPGWEDYVPRYTQLWARLGVTRYQVIVPGEHGALDLETALDALDESTGILIGGGDAPTYQRLYATDPVRSTIHRRYRKGVPVAGLSAGALIAPKACAIAPQDRGKGGLHILPGLGLVTDLVVGVHYSEWNVLPHMVEAMVETQTANGLGIDENAGAVLLNGKLERVLGQSVFKIRVTDFAAGTYEVARAL
jgi:cyanophycinase